MRQGGAPLVAAAVGAVLAVAAAAAAVLGDVPVVVICDRVAVERAEGVLGGGSTDVVVPVQLPG